MDACDILQSMIVIVSYYVRNLLTKQGAMEFQVYNLELIVDIAISPNFTYMCEYIESRIINICIHVYNTHIDSFIYIYIYTRILKLYQ